ncbi:formate--tetrahydrofolate ligase [Brevibacterium casei]|uniref:Formate--tetrahydrofolate ligase n=1 Tax=Brevibacterium casei S18 TaxID=1229781 RepID=K9B1T6_9MICO|nr:formate--tetrahydrofolate ligase [Brevibacterium casei]EKU48757.1 formate--tetrahydrofolate ligase [Brevibacterium casei S18]MBE4693422.1 formate--tetrahydrofolate ligase [Brevibacterium casei]MBY3576545.1 formate--tetrahydrofolate ligase [Brevibacterium casei]MCT1765211.1 formate--tetrahydrofolate ligase [Brevibacterium casei]MCT2357504.1 formate--tetrahydrofolate ligase [Brevibacterium casei]
MSIDLDIALAAELDPIVDVAASLDLNPENIIPFGWTKAKVPIDVLDAAAQNATPGKLILVTAMSPTPAGEGKTTTSIGLTDGLNELAKTNPEIGRAVLALREPSMGPVFGMKGGAAGGGYAQVVPMEDINLHFTGDFAAIAAANNLAATMLDNHIHHGNELDVDPRRIHIRRVVDLNDRALRNVTIGLGGLNGGVPREDHFDIVVASEVMAVFCLATSVADLKERLGRIVVAHSRDRKPITVSDIGAAGALTALLRDALAPNLVQTLEHTPAFIHGGPFANIAHGCNSLLATKAALALGDWVVTEAGFGADLGAEKFLDIKCRAAGIWPSAVVVVATLRALKYHGGVEVADVQTPNTEAVLEGMSNLVHHCTNLRDIFGLTPVVCVNRFPSDTDEEMAAALDHLHGLGIAAVESTHWADGGTGAVPLAEAVVEAAENAGDGDAAQRARYSYELDAPLEDKIRTIAQRIYGAADVDIPAKVRRKLKQFADEGYGDLPICVAKTQYSLSTDPTLRGAPTGHIIAVRDVRLSAGAGFVVVIAGDIMTMPGLPKEPSALKIDVTEDGDITGLF